jgi:hypothetical protein
MHTYNIRRKLQCIAEFYFPQYDVRSPLKFKRRFGGTCPLCLLLFSLCFLAWLILRSLRGSHHVTPKRLFSFNTLRGLIPLANYTAIYTILYRTTAVYRRSQCQLLWIEGVTWSAQRIPKAVFSGSKTGLLTHYMAFYIFQKIGTIHYLR